MGRMYSVVFDAVAETTVQSLVRISAPATGMVVIHEVNVSQDLVETSEMLPVQLHRASTDGTGTARVPEPFNVGHAAFGGTVIDTITVDPTISGRPLRRLSENVLNGWKWLFKPETVIWLPPSGRLVVHLDAAPAASLSFSGEVVFEEFD